MSNKNKPKKIAEYHLGDILKLIPRVGQPSGKDATHAFFVDGKKYKVSLASDTLKLVAQNPICANCGIQASKVKLYRDPMTNTNFIEICIRDQYQHEYKLTKDHIVPRSRGGSDTFRNYQTMCSKCNSKKSDQYFYFTSEFWYLRWPGVGWAEGPYKLPFSTKFEGEVRQYVRKVFNYKKLPKGFECWPARGYPLAL